VLASADGKPGSAICREVGVSHPLVRRWLDRYDKEGLPGIQKDRPRPGRPRRITPAMEAEIIRRTLETEPPVGTHWSTRLMAADAGVHHATISRIWRAYGLQPHRVEFFKLSKDPQFVEKLRDVAGLYMNPPDRAVVLSVDEKSQVRALEPDPARPAHEEGTGGDHDP